MLLIYPAYNVVFIKLTSMSQFAFIFVLPVIKYILKKIVKGVVEDLEDLVPVVVITVDLFNALYQSKCMQSSASLLTTAGIILIDTCQNGYALRQLFDYIRNVEELTNDEIYAQGVLLYVLKLVNEPQQLDSSKLSQIRVRSCVSILLSKEQSEMLQRIQTLPENAVDDSEGRADESRVSGHEGRPESKKSGLPSYSAVVPWIKEFSTQLPEKSKFLVSSTKIMPSIAVRPQRSSIELSIKEKAAILMKTLELL